MIQFGGKSEKDGNNILFYRNSWQPRKPVKLIKICVLEVSSRGSTHKHLFYSFFSSQDFLFQLISNFALEFAII
jgi:hypothetical protein